MVFSGRLIKMVFTQEKAILYYEEDKITLYSSLFPEGTEYLFSKYPPHLIFKAIAKEHKIFKVTIILASNLLSFHTFLSPIMSKRDLHSFLERKVERLTHEVEAESRSWASISIGDNEQKRENFLQVIAKEKIDTILSEAQKNRITISYIGSLVMLPPIIQKSHTNYDGMLQIFVFATSIVIRVIKSEKELLIRSFPCFIERNDRQEYERLLREVQRTVLYIKQQFGIINPHSYVIGNLESEILENLIQQFDFPIKLNSLFDTIKASLEKVTHERTKESNFIPLAFIRSLQKERQALIILFLLIFISGMLGVSERLLTMQHQAEEQLYNRKKIISDQALLQIKKDSLQEIYDKIEHNREVVERLQFEKREPLGGWFSAYISQFIPNELVLKEISTTYSDTLASWQITIDGWVPRSNTNAAHLLELFQNRLIKTPSLIDVEQGWRIKWLENLKSGATSEAENSYKKFSIEGRIF